MMGGDSSESLMLMGDLSDDENPADKKFRRSRYVTLSYWEES
jgi:hypothetical protein